MESCFRLMLVVAVPGDLVPWVESDPVVGRVAPTTSSEVTSRADPWRGDPTP